MNLDFRKLSREDQIKALDNLYNVEKGCNSYLAHLIISGNYDVYGWFRFHESKEGSDYWLELSDKINKKMELKKYEVEVAETLIRIVTVEATSEEGAIEQVMHDYNNAELVLDSDDFFDVEFEIVNRD